MPGNTWPWLIIWSAHIQARWVMTYDIEKVFLSERSNLIDRLLVVCATREGVPSLKFNVNARGHRLKGRVVVILSLVSSLFKFPIWWSFPSMWHCWIVLPFVFHFASLQSFYWFSLLGLLSIIAVEHFALAGRDWSKMLQCSIVIPSITTLI